MQQEYGYN